MNMAKRRTKKMIKSLFDECVCANECTGLYQKVSLDTKEIAKFHRQYNEEETEEEIIQSASAVKTAAALVFSVNP